MQFAAKDKIFISDIKERTIKALINDNTKEEKETSKQLNKKRNRKDSTDSNNEESDNTSEISFKDKTKEERFDPNVGVIRLNVISQEEINKELQVKRCKHCNSANNNGNLKQDNKLFNIGFSQDEDSIEWKCSFCSTLNHGRVKDIPSSSSYEVCTNSTPNSDINNDTSALIFCIDLSGSMAQTYKTTHEYLERIKPLRHNNYKHKDEHYIKRLDCVKYAIMNNINHLLETSPNIKVGLVTFGVSVKVYGDCMSNQFTLEKDFYHSEENIKSFGKENSNLFQHSLKDSYKKILDKLNVCFSNGETALGPAILLSLSLLEKSPRGSRIILCTDGCANQGIGNIEEFPENAKEFYHRIGDEASKRGIAISIISFTENYSGLDILGKMAEKSGGDIKRVEPLQVMDTFNDIIERKIIATDVSVEVILHHSLMFRNEIKRNIQNNILIKYIGVITKDSEVYFEFMFKRASVISQFDDLSWMNDREIPFQCIIHYTSLDGKKYERVITKTMTISNDRNEIESQTDFEIITANAIQKTAELAEEGEYQSAKDNNTGWSNYLNSRNSNTSANAYSSTLRHMCERMNKNLNMAISSKQFNPIESDQMSQDISNFKVMNSQTLSQYTPYYY